MDYFDKISTNSFGIFKTVDNNWNYTNIMCAILIVLLIIILIVCLWRRSSFKDTGNTEKLESINLENIEQESFNNNVIYMLHRNDCPYSDKMLKLLNPNGDKQFTLNNLPVVVINIDNPDEYQSIYNKCAILLNNEIGTPTLIHGDNIFMGYSDNKDEIIKKLFPSEEDIKAKKEAKERADNLIKLHVIILVGRSSCPFCLKARDLMKKLGITFHDMDSESEDGKAILHKYNSDGVPLVCANYGQNIIKGFNEEEIKKLKNKE